jgi:hypothetical protein
MFSSQSPPARFFWVVENVDEGGIEICDLTAAKQKQQ